MKVNVILVIFLMSLLYGCDKSTVDDDGRVSYFVVGYLEVDKCSVTITPTQKLNDTFDVSIPNYFRDATVVLSDSANLENITLTFDQTSGTYMAKDLALNPSKKYRIAIKAANLDVKSTFVSPNKKLEIIDFKQIAETQNGKHYSLKCKYLPLKENSLVLTVIGSNSRPRWPESLDFTEISQCISTIGGLVIFPYCIEGEEHEFQFEIGSGFRDSIRILNLSVNGAEHLKFINSVYFITDFERAFVEQGIINSSLIGSNVAGYFTGSAKASILLK